MKTFKIIFCALTFALLSQSCTKTIDASSMENAKESINAIEESLDDDKRLEFQKALVIVMGKNFSFSNLFSNGIKGVGKNYYMLLDGKTAADVIEMAKEKQEE